MRNKTLIYQPFLVFLVEVLVKQVKRANKHNINKVAEAAYPVE